MNDTKLEEELLDTAENASDDENCPYLNSLNKPTKSKPSSPIKPNPDRERNQDDVEEEAYSDLQSAPSTKSMKDAEPKPVDIPILESEYCSISIDKKGSMMLLCHSKGVELYTSVDGEDAFELKMRVSGKYLTFENVLICRIDL